MLMKNLLLVRIVLNNMKTGASKAVKLAKTPATQAW